MTQNVFPYHHRLAIENAPWLLDVVERGMRTYRNLLTNQHDIAHLTDQDTLPTMLELCHVEAALEQLTTERQLHATHRA